MSDINVQHLAMRLREFAESASKHMPCVILVNEDALEVDACGNPVCRLYESDEILNFWLDNIDCSLLTVLTGWLLATTNYEYINNMSLEDTHKALEIALYGAVVTEIGENGYASQVKH